MSQNESTPFLVTDAKNLTLIDATRENSPWCFKSLENRYYVKQTDKLGIWSKTKLCLNKFQEKNLVQKSFNSKNFF